MTQFISMEWTLIAATFGLSLCHFEHFWGWGNTVSCRRECESHIVEMFKFMYSGCVLECISSLHLYNIHCNCNNSYNSRIYKPHTIIINDSNCGRVSTSCELSSLSIAVCDGGTEGEDLIPLNNVVIDNRDVTGRSRCGTRSTSSSKCNRTCSSNKVCTSYGVRDCCLL